MSINEHSKRPWFRLLAFCLIWTAVGLIFAGQFYLSMSKVDRTISWSYALGSSLSDWYVFALLSIPAQWLARRFTFGKDRWVWNGALHLEAALLFAGLWVVLRLVLGGLQGEWPHGAKFTELLYLQLGKTFLFNFWVYWMIIAVTHAVDYYRKFHERELRTQELETHLARAKLQALQMQMNPHFLFNTLHTISALMHRDVDAADRMVVKLSELLRLALDNTDAHVVPLEQEIEFLKRYLEIEQTRFRDRLTVQLQMGSGTLKAEVPNLVLQPLVENAIRHGIEKHARPGKIFLRALREGDELILEVEDNGSGIPPGGLKREGIGIANTRTRLQQLYGAAQEFSLLNAPSGGFLARVRLPFRPFGSLASAGPESETVLNLSAITPKKQTA